MLEDLMPDYTASSATPAELALASQTKYADEF